MAKAFTLTTSITSDTSTSAKEWPGGWGSMVVTGTWDGADVTLEYKPIVDDGDTTAEWAANTNIKATSTQEVINFRLPRGDIRATAANTGTSDLQVVVTRLRNV